MRTWTFFCTAALIAGCNCDGEGDLSRLRPQITAEPNPLSFARALVGIPTSRTLTIRNVGEIDLDVADQEIEEGSDPGFSIAGEQVRLTPSQAHDLTVRYTAPEIGTRSGAIAISSNDPMTPRLIVPIVAEGIRRTGPAIAVCVASADLGLSETCDPPLEIAFGAVSIGTALRATITLRSIGDMPVTIHSAEAAPGSDPAFAFAPPSLAETLAVDETRTIEVTLAPETEGPTDAVFRVMSDDPELGFVPIILTANGTRSALCVDPPALDFGGTAIGQPVTRTLTLTNCGAMDLDLERVEIGASAPEFTTPALSPVRLTVGEQLRVDVVYLPIDSGEDTGTLRATASVGEVFVPLRGLTAECDLNALPTAIAFGGVGENQMRQRSLLLENPGAVACSISRLALTGSPDFSLSAPPSLPAVIDPGAGVIVDLSYRPQGGGPDTGTLTVASNDPAEAEIVIPLDGHQLEAGECSLTAMPDPIAFGVVPLGSEQTRSVTVTNSGSSSCTIEHVRLASGSSPAFAASGGPTLPFLLAGRSFMAEVVFRPTQAGTATGMLEIGTGLGATSTTLIQISGAASGARLCINPSPVVFGSHGVGASIVRQTALSSCGSDALTITSLSLLPPTSAEHRVVNAPAVPFTLLGGTSLTLDLEYLSVDEGRDDGLLAVISNDAVEPTQIVPLIAAAGDACGDLRGAICGVDGTSPVANATVFVDAAQGRIETMTDANGEFILTCLPTGAVSVSVSSGSWSTTFNASITDGSITTIQQVCLAADSAGVAVVGGEWDQIERVLDRVAVPYTFYDAAMGDALLLDPAEIAQYDIVFLNCGFNDLLVTSPPGLTVLQDFVENGGSIYASDWAYDAIEVIWPSFVDFHGDDTNPNAAQNAGEFDGLADVVDASLSAALSGRTAVPITSCCTAIDSAAADTTTFLAADRFNDGGQHPLFISFEPTPTSGTVMYTDFHNNGQPDIELVFRWLINRL